MAASCSAGRLSLPVFTPHGTLPDAAFDLGVTIAGPRGRECAAGWETVAALCSTGDRPRRASLAAAVNGSATGVPEQSVSGGRSPRVAARVPIVVILLGRIPPCPTRAGQQRRRRDTGELNGKAQREPSPGHWQLSIMVFGRVAVDGVPRPRRAMPSLTVEAGHRSQCARKAVSAVSHDCA